MQISRKHFCWFAFGVYFGISTFCESLSMEATPIIMALTT